jgi:hypothetical protein
MDIFLQKKIPQKNVGHVFNVTTAVRKTRHAASMTYAIDFKHGHFPNATEKRRSRL